MPSLEDLLHHTMLATAAAAIGRTPTPEHGDFALPRPKVFDDHPGLLPEQVESIRRQPIWQFEHEAASPGVFKNVRLLSRGMGMKYSHPVSVMRELSVSDVKVTREADGATHDLPLKPEFVIGTWSLDHGEIPESDVGWWQLPAITDASLLVALAYQLVDGQMVPLPKDEVESLGDALMPSPFDEYAGMQYILDLIVTRDASAMVTIGECRYLVFVSLTTCKEHDDFAPGGLVGMARFYPHVMFMANEPLSKTEVSIRFERDAKAMTHGDPEMMDEVKALLVADSNVNRGPVPYAPRPIPFTSNIYDYYVTEAHVTLGQRAKARTEDQRRALDHPDQGPNEVTLVDARHAGSARTVAGRIFREGSGPEDLTKEPRQGQFDNVHLAPRMRLSFFAHDPSTARGRNEVVDLEDIAMVFVCMHDCVHMHARWGAWVTDKSARGFADGRPYAAPGAPAVPENQTVFSSFPNPHTHVYRAVATNCLPGHWQVFCHHGAAYAIDAWPSAAAATTMEIMRQAIFETEADWKIANLAYPHMPETWAAFYWRCRWYGVRSDDGAVVPAERLQFDLEGCLA